MSQNRFFPAHSSAMLEVVHRLGEAFFARKDGESRSQIRNCHCARAPCGQPHPRSGSPRTARGLRPSCQSLRDQRDSAVSVDLHGSSMDISKTARPGSLGILHDGFLDIRPLQPFCGYGSGSRRRASSQFMGDRFWPHRVPVVSHGSRGNLYGPLFPVLENEA